MIIQTKGIPKNFAAMTLWPFIFIRPERHNDESLIAHEMIHYREQAWSTPWWVMRYLLSKQFRLAAEVRAYKVQIESGGIPPEEAGSMLMKYRLGITYEQALKALQ